MNVEEFKEQLTKRYKFEFSDKSYGGLPWKDWYKLANMTNEINYGCDFHSGTCIQTRNRQERGSSTNPMCCCKWCSNEVGYLDFIQNDPKVISTIAGYFRAKVGFWRKGKGCILPRKYRSATCLGYRCQDSSKSTIHGNASILISFINAIRARSLKDKNIYSLGKVLIDISLISV